MVFPVCELVFTSIIDLPDRNSIVVEEILTEPNQFALYAKLHDEVRYHGIPEDIRWHCSMSKLFGWPKLVQGELDLLRGPNATNPRLLLQVDDYSNGVESHGWGPGGSLYFLMHDRDLRQHRFDRCEFEIQFA